MVLYAHAAYCLRDTRAAEALYEPLEPWADRFSTTGGTSVQGPVSYYLGGLAVVLGRLDDADAYYAQSAALCDRMGAKFFAAQNGLAWGELCLERGDAERARELLTKAHTVAAANGYAKLERRSAEVLQTLSDEGFEELAAEDPSG
jgi:hypothetical protein